MSFLTDTDVNKRAQNLFVAFETAVGVAGITLISEQADMTYFATYAADVPGVVAITGVYDPAVTGANVTLQDANTRAVFGGVGTSVGTVNNTTDSTACEFLIGTGGASAVGYYVVGLAPPYDANAYAGGAAGALFVSPIVYYTSTGEAFGLIGGGGANPAYTEGDVVGVVYDNGSGQTRFYINGAFIIEVGTANNNVRPLATSPT
jgi:hypothetical protein